ncbi:MAG: hypothetical protein JO149_06915, partial [Gammaproteobacteria bacterium]|nr:hypothetical protein [Gammaproteobacteria bacterium]
MGDVSAVVDIIYYLANESNFLDKEQFWAILYGKFSEKTEAKMSTIVQKIQEKEQIEVA